MSARGNSRGRGRGRVNDLVDVLIELEVVDDSEERLKDRVRQLKLTADDISKHAELVNELIKEIVSALKDTASTTLQRWGELRSGSYYDKTKVTLFVLMR
jgi:hypothetical protein